MRNITLGKTPAQILSIEKCHAEKERKQLYT
jgi:hypothetical protein